MITLARTPEQRWWWRVRGSINGNPVGQDVVFSKCRKFDQDTTSEITQRFFYQSLRLTSQTMAFTECLKLHFTLSLYGPDCWEARAAYWFDLLWVCIRHAASKQLELTV